MKRCFHNPLKKHLLTLAGVILFTGMSWGQATLPLTRTTWDATPTGWTDSPLQSYLTSFACSGNNGGKFAATGDRYLVYFNSAPNQLSFVIKSNSATTSSLLVEESSDGITFTTVINLVATADMPTTCTTKGPYSLSATSRYVRWTFTKGSSNATIDDISITIPGCTPPTTQASNLSFSNVQTSQMDVSFTRGNGNRVLVIAKAGSAPTDPTSGTSYTASATYGSGNVVGGGFAVYDGTGSGFTLSGLSPNITYYLAIYEYNTTGTCYNLTELAGNQITLCNDPTTQASAIVTSSVTSTTATISFTNGNGSSRLVVVKSGSAVGGIPADGTAYTANTVFGSGNTIAAGEYVVYSNTGSSVSITGLTANTTYYISVFEFNNTSNCYLTSSPATSNFITTSAATDFITANGESATISSLINTTGPLTSVQGTQVWQFTIRDGGAGLNDADNLPSIVTAITFSQATGDAVGTWNTAIQAIDLFDGATNIGSGTVTSNQVQFTGLNINVPDNTQKTISVRLTLKCPLGAGNLDNDDFGFQISNGNVTLSSSGSGKSGFAAITTINGQNAISVAATQLTFTQQPSNTGSGQTMSPGVTVAATDVCGNTDIDYTGTVSLTSTGSMTVSPINVALSSGVATFSTIIHSVTGTGISLSASLAGLTSANSNTFEITSYTAIPDNGCATSNFATSVINYTNNLIISDVNVGVKISHTYRGDLNIYLVAPDATTVLLIASVGSTADNLDGIIDDQASANQFSIVTNHVIDGIYDVNGKPEGTGTGLLSAFNGLSSSGNWTLKICDDAGVDIGGLISWELFITGTPPCAFNAGSVTGAPFSVNCSTGSAGTVAYSSTCTFTGNTFTAQLSNASGSFASPTNIGTLVSDVNTGNINITIPANTVTGAGYLIRIISTSPAYTSSNSAAFSINNTVPCTITPGAIGGAPFSVNCTSPASGTIAFTSTATYTGNTYTAQLSDATGSFAAPTNIGTLVSNANSGIINITIPAGMPTGAGYVIRIISNSPSVTGSSSSSFGITLSGGPCQAFEIQSILVDACDGGTGLEGENEMVRFQVGGSALNTSNLTVSWPNAGNPWRGICQNGTTAATVAAINSTITGGGMLIEPTGGILPANAQVMFFTSTAFNYTLFDFTSLNYTLYAIFQCSGNTAGHFVNHSSTNPTNRTLTMTFTGFGTDAVTYNAYYVYSGDGGAVDFTPAGVPSYGSTGGCLAPVFPLPVELGNFSGKLIEKKVLLTWQTVSEINNDYFEIEKSSDLNSFQKIGTVAGAGNSNTVLSYDFIDDNPFPGNNYYKLKQVDFDGESTESNIIVVSVNQNSFVNVFVSANSTLTISATNSKIEKIEILDITGKVISVISIFNENTEIQFNTTGISQGIYFVRIIGNSFTETRKLYFP